jgi:hypothetical protein
MMVFTLSACGPREENSEGNGPGNADGFGGRADPPAQHPSNQNNAQQTQDPPASEQPQQ